MLQFKAIPFADLSVFELHAVLKLRAEVFIVEQNCPYLDPDDKDLDGVHLLGYDEQANLVACARLLPAGVSYEHYASIGRVATAASARGIGAGRQLMAEAMRQMPVLFPDTPIKISAQSYLIRFYESYGFVPLGEDYLEDDIPHRAMTFKNN